MYSHPKMRDFDERLNALFREVDRILEDRWGGEYSLRPNRPPRGSTCDPSMDGLFRVDPDFTLGIGSERGRGYLVTLKVATSSTVPPERFDAFMDEAAEFVASLLPRYFPERTLELVRDGDRFKIVGDFSLGAL